MSLCRYDGGFSGQENIALVASPGRERCREITKLTGCSPAKKWVLLSFNTLEWTEQALQRVRQLTEYEFFTLLPLQWEGQNVHAIDRGIIPYSDLLASVDGMLSKPGFGVVSECIVNKKPLVFADRSDFMEYPLLVEGIKKYLCHTHIPSKKLYAGELKEALDAVPVDRLENDGAGIAVEKMLERYND